MSFIEKANTASTKNNSFLCVGLDPDIKRLPKTIQRTSSGVLDFCKRIVDATKHTACSYKPQIAYFSSIGAHEELKELIQYIKNETICPVILDGKRGDIDTTSVEYAKEAFEYYEADATTVNPYMGMNGLEPFLSYKDKGIIVLCRTSNPTSDLIQNLELKDGSQLYQKVARYAVSEWNYNNNVLLVAAATRIEEIREIRKIVGEMPLLIPGVGVQGGDIGEVIKAAKGGGIVINSSRAINYAGTSDNFELSAEQEAEKTCKEINDAIEDMSAYRTP